MMNGLAPHIRRPPLTLLLLVSLVLPSCAVQPHRQHQRTSVPIERQEAPVTSERPEKPEKPEKPGKTQQSTSIQTGPAHTLYAKANEALTSGLPAQAEMLLERALRLEPRNALYWHLLGQSKYAQGDYVQAVQCCRKSDTLAGNNTKLRQLNKSLLQKAFSKLGNTQQTEKFNR